MTRQILTVFLVMVTLSVVGQDTIIDKTGRKLPVYITNLTAEKVTFIAANDSTGKETTLFRKYLNGIIINKSAERRMPFRKANTIIVYTQQSDSANYINFQRQLLKEDYFVRQSNPQIFSLVTSEHALKKHPGWSYSYYFQVFFHDGKIVIKPYWKANIILKFKYVENDNSAIRWHYATSRSDIQNMIWIDIKDLLSTFPHTKITYSEH